MMNRTSGMESNVFVDVGRYNLTQPDITIENNTFLRVARTNNPVVSRASHPINVNSAVGATNVTIRGNIFVDCGQPSGAIHSDQVGWYEISGPTNSFVTAGNFVAGSPPTYQGKTGFLEGNPLLNGGDPRFVNMADPLGPDGLPFTDDDGLRLLPTSKLIAPEVGYPPPGAYQLPGGGPPRLAWRITGGDQMQLTWPETVERWTLQCAPTLSGPWTNVSPAALLESGWRRATVPVDRPADYFRLAP